MRIRQIKGKEKFKLDVSAKELKTITIALANLSMVDFDDDVASNNLTEGDVAFGHIGLVDQLCKVTGLYPIEEQLVELIKDGLRGDD